MTFKQIVLVCLIVTITSAGLTRYYFPQVQNKIVEVTKEVVRTDIKTVVHTVTLPNGNIETTTETTDHSIKTETEKRTAIINLKPDWLVSGTAQSNFKLELPIYGIQIQRRILGPLMIGTLLNTKGEIGLSLGMEF